MIASSSNNLPIIDLYPIVMELDDVTLDHGRINNNPNLAANASLYDAVASEASWFASERSWRLDEGSIRSETEEEEHGDNNGSPTTSIHQTNPPSPPSLRRTHSYGPSHRHDDCVGCGDRTIKSTTTSSSRGSGGIFANIRSLLQSGSHGYKHKNGNSASTCNNNNNNNNKTSNSICIESSHHRNPTPETVPFSNVSPMQSPIRMGTKRNRPRRFNDEYVLTQQIAQCRIATLWECVHRPTGRRYCAKAIDKRRFASRSDRTMAVREITMQRLISQLSPASCLPRIRDIFADGEVADPSHHDNNNNDSKSFASCCSESTRSISSHSACDDSNWYIVQDFEAGGGNLGLYLLSRENAIFEMLENGGEDDNGEQHEINSTNDADELCALAEASRSASKTMQESEVRSLARSLLLALNELHRRSICHNDLCPENILVPLLPNQQKEVDEHSRGRVAPRSYRHSRHRRKQLRDESSDGCWEALKLCDLGRSFFVDDDPDTGNNTSSTPRHGSIHYTSPEVIKGKSPSLASDMWSVGIILYRCFAGELPFREQSSDNDSAASLAPYSSNNSTLVPPSSTRTTRARTTTIQQQQQQQLKRDICKADCNFGRSSSSSRRNRSPGHLRWSRVSRGAKQFISALLNPSSSVRMTCDEALYHPWLAMITNMNTNGATTVAAQWSTTTAPKYCSPMPPPPSSSSLTTASSIAPSWTSKNHYHHLPKYTTTRANTQTAMNQGDYSSSSSSRNHHHRVEIVHGEGSAVSCPPTLSYSSDGSPQQPPIDESTRQPVLGSPKLFVRKILGRLITSSNNNGNHNKDSNRHGPTANTKNAQFVID